jgi:hypothetical protein
LNAYLASKCGCRNAFCKPQPFILRFWLGFCFGLFDLLLSFP